MTTGVCVQALLLLGPPGGGKGTVAKYLMQAFRGRIQKHLSIGDVLRERATADQRALMSAGQLLPSASVRDLLLDAVRLDAPSQHSPGHDVSCTSAETAAEDSKMNAPWIILDGFPRNVEQAEMLRRMVPFLRPRLAVFLDVPEGEIVERVGLRWVHAESGRVYNAKWNPPKVPGRDDATGEPLVRRRDDDPDVVEERLRVFRESTWQPLLDFYNQGGGFGRRISTPEGDETDRRYRNDTEVADEQSTQAFVFSGDSDLNLVRDGRRSEAIFNEMTRTPEFMAELLGGSSTGEQLPRKGNSYGEIHQIESKL
eukprot:g19077.t1